MAVAKDKTQKLIDLICGDDGGSVCILAISQLVSTMEKTCEECMKDRKTLLLDPLCKDRFYLSLLIEAEVSSDEIPKDCYRMRLEEVKKLLNGKAVPLSVHDATIKVKDFIKILAGVVKIKGLSKKIHDASQKSELISIMKSILEKADNIDHTDISNKTIIIVYQNKPIVNVIDFSRRIAHVNLEIRRPDIDTLRGLTDLLMRRYEISGKFHESLIGNVYLQLDIVNNLDISVIKRILSDVGVAILDRKNKKVLSVKVVEEGDVVVTFSQIVELIRYLSGESE
ncbi:MAG: hypothetical protein Q6363_005510 [Candidatus Njordarchaeota archaeon]